MKNFLFVSSSFNFACLVLVLLSFYFSALNFIFYIYFNPWILREERESCQKRGDKKERGRLTTFRPWIRLTLVSIYLSFWGTGLVVKRTCFLTIHQSWSPTMYTCHPAMSYMLTRFAECSLSLGISLIIKKKLCEDRIVSVILPFNHATKVTTRPDNFIFCRIIKGCFRIENEFIEILRIDFRYFQVITC